MRCCTALSLVLDKLGVLNQIHYHDTIHFLDADGKRSQIKGCGLPAPLHTSLSFLAFKSLKLADKITIGRGMIAMLMTDGSSDEGISIDSWFQKTKQTERAVQRFWSPILVSACNETIDRISVLHAFKIFRDGFLLNAEAFHFGIPKVPLGTLYSNPTVQYLAARNGSVHLRTIVENVQMSSSLNKVEAILLRNGERIEADYFVFALQQDLLLKLLPAEITGANTYWDGLRTIEMSPIIGIHLWFNGEIDCPEALALLDRPTEWIFNKNKSFTAAPKGITYLSAVISASRRFTNTTQEELLQIVLRDLKEALPQVADASLLKSQVIKWPKATFSPVAGVEKLRPTQQSPIDNLILAGEWTQTGWPSTMESAARSGLAAAECVMRSDSGTDMCPNLIPRDLKRGMLTKIFAANR